MCISTTGKTDKEKNALKEKFEDNVKKATNSFKFLRVEE